MLAPPYIVLRDFLDDTTVSELLDFAVDSMPGFVPTALRDSVVAPAVRLSTATRALGRFGPLMTAKVTDLLPTLTKSLGMSALMLSRIETELVAHGDGAFYKRHIDTGTGDRAHRFLRVVSAVYYFHAQPKAFTGGALRLYAIGGGHEDFVDVRPEHNSLLAFPSWAPHEVMPISCPSKRFVDSRFAINCWVHRAEAAA